MRIASYIKIYIFVMKNFYFFLFGLLITLSGSFPAYADIYDLPDIPYQRTLSVDINTEFYRTVTNYTTLGNYDDLSPNAFFQYVAFRPKVTYFPLKWFSLKLQAEGMLATSVKKFERQSPHFNSYAGGFALHTNKDPFYISTGLTVGNSINQFFENTDMIVTGCSCYFIEPDFSFIYNIQSLFYIFYNTSLRYRSFQLSSLWFHKIGGYFRTSRINLGFSSDLFFSVLPDFYQNQPNKRTDVLDKVNAGSYKFYAVNPAALSFTGWIEWKINTLSVTLYGNVDTYGKNYARGLTLGLSGKMKFAMEATSSDYEDYQHLKKQPETTKESKYFEEDSDEEGESNIFPEEDSQDSEEDSSDIFPEEDSQDSEEDADTLPEEDSRGTRKLNYFEAKKAKPKMIKRQNKPSNVFSLSQELAREIHHLKR